MHELGVTFSVLDRLEEVVKDRNVDRITKVVLELGEVSTVIPEYMYDCWKWACAKRQLFKNCELKIITIHALTYCESCKQKYDTVEHGKICPNCGSDKTYLYCGNEFNIKEIEVPE